MNGCDITALVLTYNEAPNLQRTLRKLEWLGSVLIVDSFSTDRTLEIAAAFPNVRVVQRAFDSFADQCNFGLTQIESPWVLSMDADYVLSDELVAEVGSLEPPSDVMGYSAAFQYWIHGKAISATLYPPRKVLYRRDRALYESDGHAHRVLISGEVRSLSSLIYHDDRKPLSRWFASQAKYAALEAEKLLSAPKESLRLQDRLRLTGWAAIPASLVYTLLVKRTLLDGWRGWYYALQRTLAEIMLALEILERRLGR